MYTAYNKNKRKKNVKTYHIIYLISIKKYKLLVKEYLLKVYNLIV